MKRAMVMRKRQEDCKAIKEEEEGARKSCRLTIDAIRMVRRDVHLKGGDNLKEASLTTV